MKENKFIDLVIRKMQMGRMLRGNNIGRCPYCKELVCVYKPRVSRKDAESILLLYGESVRDSTIAPSEKGIITALSKLSGWTEQTIKGVIDRPEAYIKPKP